MCVLYILYALFVINFSFEDIGILFLSFFLTSTTESTIIVAIYVVERERKNKYCTIVLYFMVSHLCCTLNDVGKVICMYVPL